MLAFKSPSWDNFNALTSIERDLTKGSCRALLIEIQGLDRPRTSAAKYSVPLSAVLSA
jgi:hypothetical protein